MYNPKLLNLKPSNISVRRGVGAPVDAALHEAPRAYSRSSFGDFPYQD